MFTNREEFIKELTLREHIRSVAKKLINENKKELKAALKEEQVLRKIIKDIITEAAEEMAPHENTGINVLADLLKKNNPSD